MVSALFCLIKPSLYESLYTVLLDLRYEYR